MNTVALERAALRAMLGILRCGIRDDYLPGNDALEPYQRAVRDALDAIDQLEIALLQLDVATTSEPIGDFPF